MKILIFDQQKDLSLDTGGVDAIVHFVLKGEQRTTDEVSIYFVSKEEISTLHDQFFNDPSPTDCISFPMDHEEASSYHILGEIFVCPKVAIEYSLDKELCAYQETTLYVVHGLLHLLGYCDEEEALRTKMHAIQNQYLANLKANNLLIKAKPF